MSVTFEYDPESAAGKNCAFIAENYQLLSKLYPNKWVVVYRQEVLFVCDSSEEMFAKAKSLGMERGSYYYRHIRVEPYVEVASPAGI